MSSHSAHLPVQQMIQTTPALHHPSSSLNAFVWVMQLTNVEFLILKDVHLAFTTFSQDRYICGHLSRRHKFELETLDLNLSADIIVPKFVTVTALKTTGFSYYANK